MTSGKKSTQICEHEKIKVFCKECGGSQICEHGKRRSFCVDCGGSQVCKHKKQKHNCSKCREERFMDFRKEMFELISKSKSTREELAKEIDVLLWASVNCNMKRILSSASKSLESSGVALLREDR